MLHNEKVRSSGALDFLWQSAVPTTPDPALGLQIHWSKVLGLVENTQMLIQFYKLEDSLGCVLRIERIQLKLDLISNQLINN